jgi:sulfotransferase
MSPPLQNRLHFISGLPRSGSTLLAALLRQNPRFSAGMSSPVHALFRAMLNETSARNEGSVFIDNDIRKRLLAAVFEACYAEAAPETVIFDTNRGWTTKLPPLVELVPGRQNDLLRPQSGLDPGQYREPDPPQRL